MKRLFPLAGLLTLAACGLDEDVETSSSNHAVVNGQVSPPGADPAVVMLQLGQGAAAEH